MAGTVELNGYVFGRDGRPVGDHRMIFVQPADELRIETTSDALNRGRGVHVTGTPTTIVTNQGKQGAKVRVTGPHTAGLIAAFVFGSRGVEAVATGPTDAGPEPSTAVLRMIGTISHSAERKQ